VFAEQFFRNGLHNHIVTPPLSADDIKKASSSIVACWTVFTELLPGNALIKSGIICSIAVRAARGIQDIAEQNVAIYVEKYY
jgi:hypothetical protein